MSKLLVDIETFPAHVLTWGSGMYKQTVIKVKDPWRIASFAYKWLGDKKVECIPAMGCSRKTELSLLKQIYPLLDEADTVIAHHAKFDLGKILAKGIIYDLAPPSQFRLECTYLAARRFAFTSKRLNHLCQEMGIGEKTKHRGFDLWEECMEGPGPAWDELCEYNKQDVVLLEGLYERLEEYVRRDTKVSATGVFT